MRKTIYKEDYKLILQLLTDARTAAGLTQEELADRLKVTQSFISKCERGERRLDILDLRDFCEALGTSLPAFVRKLERAWKA
jgi:transcriptional regulator with XRE-family HTH domain